VAQNDIKKVLAYSTVSQLGYMFLGAGVGAYSAAIFHLYTHAFFKALLFLGSGSVIHAMGGEQDMRKMGGLRRVTPITFWTFLLATAAIAGVPLFSGFFSKDEILHAAAAGGDWLHSVLYWIALATAGLTAFYMCRALGLTFGGEFRGGEERRHHLHESPRTMTVPLLVLAAGSVAAGWVGIPKLLTAGKDLNWFHQFLAPVVTEVEGVGHEGAHAPELQAEVLLLVAAISVAGVGIFLAWRAFGRSRGLAADEAFARRAPGLHRLLANKWYVDELYDATVVRGFWASCRAAFRFDASVIDGFLVNGSAYLTRAVSTLSGFFDKYVVDGLVNAVAAVLQLFSRGFRRLQTGVVSQYALVLALGVVALVCLYLIVST
jgi:NADH-quinone oxidoreductase subunit L